MLVWRKANVNRTVSVLQYCVPLQRYEQVLQVSRLYQALILLGLALYHLSTSVSLIFMALYIHSSICFWLHLFPHLLVS